ncbi:MAG: MFS transporter [Pontiella sp.]
MKKSFEQIPLSPAQWPFYYGWMILFWGIIGIILSVPGQTTGVSAFIEPLIEDLNIGRFELSVAYGIGTLFSSLFITPSGKLFDRIGARWMGFGSCLILGMVLLALSQVDHLAKSISKILPKQVGLMSLLSFLFFTLRLSGQGVLTMSSRNMIMKWFVHHRGIVSGISGAAVAFGFSYTPTFFSGMIDARGWSNTWMLLGLLLLFIFAPLLLLFFRDNPEASGLVPDGRVRTSNERKESTFRVFTLPEARRTLPFWAFTITISLQSLILTANTFHVESIFIHAGMDAETGFATFLPIAFISIAVTLLGGWLSDRTELRWLLIVMLASMIINLIGMAWLAPGWPIACLILGGGIANGLFGILMSVTWPRFFGREHLGAISGFCMTFIVIFSAIGPAIYSGVLKFTGGYALGNLACLALTTALLAFSFKAKSPQPAP